MLCSSIWFEKLYFNLLPSDWLVGYFCTSHVEKVCLAKISVTSCSGCQVFSHLYIHPFLPTQQGNNESFTKKIEATENMAGENYLRIALSLSTKSYIHQPKTSIPSGAPN